MRCPGQQSWWGFYQHSEVSADPGLHPALSCLEWAEYYDTDEDQTGWTWNKGPKKKMLPHSHTFKYFQNWWERRFAAHSEWWDWPLEEGGEGEGAGCWCKDTDLEPETRASALRSGHELMALLRSRGDESSLSSNSRVRLLNRPPGPVMLDWRGGAQVLEGAAASGTDAWALSLRLCSDAPSCPRRLLSLLVSLLMGPRETLLDCGGGELNNHPESERTATPHLR